MVDNHVKCHIIKEKVARFSAMLLFIWKEVRAVLSRTQKAVIVADACLALVLVAIVCMYPVQSIIVALVLGKFYLR